MYRVFLLALSVFSAKKKNNLLPPRRILRLRIHGRAALVTDLTTREVSAAAALPSLATFPHPPTFFHESQFQNQCSVNINPNAIQPWSKITGDLASSERMRKSFGVSPESASTSDQMCASSHKSDSKVIALHLKKSWKPQIRWDFKLTHPLCKPFHHCLWWSIHLARHWLRSSDGKDSVLYCSQAEVETSWLGTKREENADSIIPDPEPDCPPVMPIAVVRISWKHFDSRKIITQSLEQVFWAVIVY